MVAVRRNLTLNLAVPVTRLAALDVTCVERPDDIAAASARVRLGRS